MKRVTVVFTLLLALSTLSGCGSEALESAPEPVHWVFTLSDEELLFYLPEDADLDRLDRQRRAMQKGWYWSHQRLLRPYSIPAEFDRPV